MKRLAWVLIMAATALPLAARAQTEHGKKDDYYEDGMASLKFVVVKDYNGKPVRNAGIVMHPVNSKNKQSRGGLELKSDAEGKASFDGIPYGKLRVQVLAPGFQTYGEDFDIAQPTVEITVRMKRPQGQYSVYDQPDEKKDPGAKPQ